MRDTSIGIDNGTSGTIGILGPGTTQFVRTPTYKEMSPLKTKVRMDSHIDTEALAEMLRPFVGRAQVFLERPYTGGRVMTCISAGRADEATKIVLKDIGMPYDYIDSRQWQIPLFPTGTKGSDKLKAASKALATRLYPEFTDLIKRHGDADGLLIAKWGLTQL